MSSVKVIDQAVNELKKLPGIGPKSAHRLAMHLLAMPYDDVRELARTLLRMKKAVRVCVVCFNWSEAETCSICADPERDRSMICVVEDTQDVEAMERTRSFRGLYHVLQGAIKPLDGVGPDQLRIKELVDRLKGGEVREIIVATNPDSEGEATALYLARLLKPLELKITRLARGLPVGADLDYVDEMTIIRSLEGRIVIE